MLVVFLALYPRRLQAAAAAAVVALVLARALPTLLDVFRADVAERPDALADVAVALGIVAAVLAAVGAALPLLDRLWLSVAVRRVLLVVGVVLAIGGLVAFAVRDDPAGRVHTGWHQFTQDRNAASSGSHSVGLGATGTTSGASASPSSAEIRSPASARTTSRFRISRRDGVASSRFTRTACGCGRSRRRASSELHCWRPPSAQRCGPSSGGTDARCRWRS